MDQSLYTSEIIKKTTTTTTPIIYNQIMRSKEIVGEKNGALREERKGSVAEQKKDMDGELGQ